MADLRVRARRRAGQMGEENKKQARRLRGWKPDGRRGASSCGLEQLPSWLIDALLSRKQNDAEKWKSANTERDCEAALHRESDQHVQARALDFFELCWRLSLKRHLFLSVDSGDFVQRCIYLGLGTKHNITEGVKGENLWSFARSFRLSVNAQNQVLEWKTFKSLFFFLKLMS